MGWTFEHRAKGTTNYDHFFSIDDLERLRIHAHGTVNNVFYAAVEDLQHEPGKVFALVILTQWAPNSYFNFGYKDLHEDMGPGASEAPRAVLDALTETDVRWAQEWRARCEEHHARRDWVRTYARKDSMVRLTRTVEFTNGDSSDRFYVGSNGKLYLPYSGIRVRLTGWRNMVTQVVTADGEVYDYASELVSA